MKTEQEKKQVDLQAVLAAVAPARRALFDASEKLADLGRKHAATVEEINKLIAQKEAGKGSTNSQAAALLRGESVSDKPLEEAILAARRRCGVFEEAHRMQVRVVSDLNAAVSGEVNRVLRAQRQPFVTRVNASLAELRALDAEEAKLRADLRSAGVDDTHIEPLAFTQVSAGCPFDEAWRRGMKSMGYTV